MLCQNELKVQLAVSDEKGKTISTSPVLLATL
jgi:hypothetical protein